MVVNELMRYLLLPGYIDRVTYQNLDHIQLLDLYGQKHIPINQKLLFVSRLTYSHHSLSKVLSFNFGICIVIVLKPRSDK